MLDIGLLRNGIKGEVLEHFSEEYSTDISGRERKCPLVVVKATCEADVIHILNVAHTSKIPVNLRGGGFSFNGQTLNENGILLVNYSETPEFELKANGEVEVSGRTRWYELETALNHSGRSMPVLTTFLGSTVAGTLSAGGYGPRSLTASAQIEHVSRLRLIQPDGTAIWCSQKENPDLFRFALAGQGHIGVIECATIQTVPYKPVLTQYIYQHKTLSELITSLEWLVAGQTAEYKTGFFPDLCMAIMQPKNQQILSIYSCEYESQSAATRSRQPEHFEQVPPASVQSVPASNSTVVNPNVPAMKAQYAKTVNLWADWVNTWAGFLEVMSLIETRAIHKYLDLMLILPIRTNQIGMKLPFAAHQITDEPVVFLTGLYYFVPPQDKNGIEQVTEILTMIQDVSLQRGGRPYLYGFHNMNDEQKRQLYGNDYDRMKGLHRQLDPDNLFNAHTL